MAGQAVRQPTDQWAPIILGAVLGMILSGGLAVGVGVRQSASPATGGSIPFGVFLPIYSGDPVAARQVQPLPPVAPSSNAYPDSYGTAGPYAPVQNREPAIAPDVSPPRRAASQEEANTSDSIQLEAPTNAPIAEQPSSD